MDEKNLVNINIRLTPSQKEEVKRFLGENVSKLIRNHLQLAINVAKGNAHYCSVCMQTNVTESFATILISFRETDKYHMDFICEHCFRSIACFNLEEFILKQNKTEKESLLAVYHLFACRNLFEDTKTGQLNYDFDSEKLKNIYNSLKYNLAGTFIELSKVYPQTFFDKKSGIIYPKDSEFNEEIEDLILVQERID